MSSSRNVLASRVLALLVPVTLGRLSCWHSGRSNPNHNDATEEDPSASFDSVLVVLTRLSWTYLLQCASSFGQWRHWIWCPCEKSIQKIRPWYLAFWCKRDAKFMCFP